jgi:hypothetical protein
MAAAAPHRRACWVLAGLAALSTGCDLSAEIETPAVTSPFNCEQAWPPTQSPVSIPADWDEAVMRIVGCLPAGEYQAIRQRSEADYLAWTDMRLGIVLRNQWIRVEGSPLLADLRSLGFEYPDDMSAALLSAVWHWVHGQQLDVRTRVRCIRAWNAEMQRLARSTPIGRPIPDPDFRCDDDQAVRAGSARWPSEGL